jgi:hypothetical protein
VSKNAQPSSRAARRWAATIRGRLSSEPTSPFSFISPRSIGAMIRMLASGNALRIRMTTVR